MEEKPDPRKTLGVKVATIGDGKSFGELALQNSDNKRAASCVTDTDVSMASKPTNYISVHSACEE